MDISCPLCNPKSLITSSKYTRHEFLCCGISVEVMNPFDTFAIRVKSSIKYKYCVYSYSSFPYKNYPRTDTDLTGSIIIFYYDCKRFILPIEDHFSVNEICLTVVNFIETYFHLA